MGRCWAILEGGNRGNVLMRSAVAVRYGDCREGIAVSGEDPGDSLKRSDPLKSAAIAVSCGVWSLVRAMRVRFTE